MEPLKILEFLKDDIYKKSIAGSYLTPEEANNLIATLNLYIEKLRAVRNSEEYTKDILLEIDKLPKHISPGIKFWLFKLLADADSFSIAYDRISTEISTEQLVNITQKNFSTPELIEIIEAEENQVGSPKGYIIRNDNEMSEIYTLCQGAFNCEYSTFRDAIENANFNLLKIKKITLVKDLTYRLSGIMGNDWYGAVCKRMNWEKGDCSGQGQKLTNNPLTKNLNKKLKRPER